MSDSSSEEAPPVHTPGYKALYGKAFSGVASRSKPRIQATLKRLRHIIMHNGLEDYPFLLELQKTVLNDIKTNRRKLRKAMIAYKKVQEAAKKVGGIRSIAPSTLISGPEGTVNQEEIDKILLSTKKDLELIAIQSRKTHVEKLETLVSRKPFEVVAHYIDELLLADEGYNILSICLCFHDELVDNITAQLNIWDSLNLITSYNNKIKAQETEHKKQLTLDFEASIPPEQVVKNLVAAEVKKALKTLNNKNNNNKNPKVTSHPNSKVTPQGNKGRGTRGGLQSRGTNRGRGSNRGRGNGRGRGTGRGRGRGNQSRGRGRGRGRGQPNH